LATIDALKAARVEPQLLARTVAAEKCVRMVAAAHAWRCGERFSSPHAAMLAFHVASTNPKASELRNWETKLARLAAYESAGANLTIAEQAYAKQFDAEREAEQQVVARQEPGSTSSSGE
jgi:hypothetical protein